jgi:chromosomal replication initiator protein
MKPEQAWQAAVGHLQMEMPKASFNTWVRDSEMVSYEDGSFIIGVQNAYARDWLDSRLSSTVKRLLTGMMNRSVDVRFVIWQNEANIRLQAGEDYDLPVEIDDVQITASQVSAAAAASACSAFITRYSFDNFVVGTSNRLAHAACLAVAENPARAYNPLFLYGGAGMGKTHLLHAMGSQCTRNGLHVLYVTSEEFTNDLINAIRTHTTQAFREKYRRPDLLLIDDIQFIAGKESTQEEFFHTFNALHGQDKQLVITSDRPPKAMVTLEERLRSRFEWGLIADIQPPDYETRLAVLRSKAERAGYRLHPEILELIGRRVQSNFRELEGALTRVAAFSDLSGMPMTVQLAETVMIDLLPRRSEVQPEEVVRKVADTFGVAVERMLGRDRSREVALPRQIAMYLLREEAHISLPQIGETLGGRDHTTIMYGCEKISELLEEDDRLRRQVLEIKEQLYGPSKMGY